MAKKVSPLSPESIALFELLKAQPAGVTAADVKALGFAANSANFTALANRGLITSTSVEREVVTVAKRTVNEYTVVEGAVIPE